MQRLVLLASYFFLLPLIIFSLSLYALFFYFSPNLGKVKGTSISYQAVTETDEQLHAPVVSEARVDRIAAYLNRHKSKLAPYAQFIVQTSDSYGLDYRLTTAIAMAESTLCRNEQYTSHNCWGYGITGGKVKWFNSYEDAITEVSRSLSETYAGLGLNTPHEIVTRYNPGSETWAPKVEQFMYDIENSL